MAAADHIIINLVTGNWRSNIDLVLEIHWQCPNITTTNAKITPALIIFSPQCLLFMRTILLNWPTKSGRRYIVAGNLRSKNDLLLKNHWPWPRYGGGRSLEVIYTENAFGIPNGDC